MIKASKSELKARVIRLDMKEMDYQQILGGPPDSVTMRSGLVRLSPGKSVGVHNTNGYEELIVVLEGKGEMRVTGQDSLTIGTGSTAYCPPETEHNVVNTGNDVLKYVYIVAMAK